MANEVSTKPDCICGHRWAAHRPGTMQAGFFCPICGCDGYEPMQSEGDVFHEDTIHAFGTCKDCDQNIYRGDEHATTINIPSERLADATGHDSDGGGDSQRPGDARGRGAQPATSGEPDPLALMGRIADHGDTISREAREMESAVEDLKRLLDDLQTENYRLRAKVASWGQL